MSTQFLSKLSQNYIELLDDDEYYDKEQEEHDAHHRSFKNKSTTSTTSTTSTVWFSRSRGRTR